MGAAGALRELQLLMVGGQLVARASTREGSVSLEVDLLVSGGESFHILKQVWIGRSLSQSVWEDGVRSRFTMIAHC